MKLVFPRLYVIMDAKLLRTSELAFAQMLAESGAELVQYRDKLSSPKTFFGISQRVVNLLRPQRVRVIVNDRPDVAALAGADGVHVGQEDVAVEDARAVGGKDFWVGVSTHTLEQVREAGATSADYIAVGPIFPTATKENPDPVVGLDFVRRARALTQKPLVAIGGITLERAEAVYRAGADSLAVAADLLSAASPGTRVQDYLNLAASVLGDSN